MDKNIWKKKMEKKKKKKKKKEEKIKKGHFEACFYCLQIPAL